MESQAANTLNALLRGEIAATETYQQALGTFDSGMEDRELRQIHTEHRQAANTLRQHVHSMGGTPSQNSGVWGAFAKAVEGTAKVFGNQAALKALKEGEEHGLKQYQDALQEQALPFACISLIQSTLLPQTQTHIATLERLMSAEKTHA